MNPRRSVSGKNKGRCDMVFKIGKFETVLVPVVTSVVDRFPTCDYCVLVQPLDSNRVNTPAEYDGKTKNGPWAYMCPAHFKSHGVGLGTGKGQRLVLRSTR